jgi:hypothetical protein
MNLANRELISLWSYIGCVWQIGATQKFPSQPRFREKHVFVSPGQLILATPTSYRKGTLGSPLWSSNRASQPRASHPAWASSSRKNPTRPSPVGSRTPKPSATRLLSRHSFFHPKDTVASLPLSPDHRAYRLRAPRPQAPKTAPTPGTSHATASDDSRAATRPSSSHPAVARAPPLLSDHRTAMPRRPRCRQGQLEPPPGHPPVAARAPTRSPPAGSPHERTRLLFFSFFWRSLL